MPNYVTQEDFGAFGRKIAAFKDETAGEVEGEKIITRHVLEQSIRNGDVLHALRSEVASFRADLHALTARADHIAGDVVQGNAVLKSHGRRLDTLTQDVMLLRQDVTQLRRDMEGMDAKLDAVLTAIRALAPRDPPAAT